MIWSKPQTALQRPEKLNDIGSEHRLPARPRDRGACDQKTGCEAPLRGLAEHACLQPVLEPQGPFAGPPGPAAIFARGT